MIYGLGLFEGIAGLTIALSKWVQPIAYCEIEDYPTGVLLSRISEGRLPNAPIWDDIRTLRGDMLPVKPDIVYGGFPCQDVSCAGSRKGLEGERSGLFFEAVRVIAETKPTFIFLENVQGIKKFVPTVRQHLEALGFDCRDGFLSAAEIGANHKRNRWWLLGYSKHNGSLAAAKQGGADSTVLNNPQGKDETSEPSGASTSRMLAGETFPDTICDGGWVQSKWEDRKDSPFAFDDGTKKSLGDTSSEGFQNGGNGTMGESRSQQESKRSDWWSTEPAVGRVLFDGVSIRLGENIDEELSLLWRTFDTKTIWDKTGRFYYLSEAKILRSFLCSEGSNQGISIEIGNSETLCKIQKRILRVMQIKGDSLLAPHRWKLEEQQYQEFNDAMFCLSYIFASSTGRLGAKETEKALLYLWSGIVSIESMLDTSYTLQEAWRSIDCTWKKSLFMSPWNIEPLIPRTTHNLPSRVDRIKCLGNAVVPQQAKKAFEILLYGSRVRF